MDEYAASGRWWVLVKTGIKIQDFRQKQEQLQFPEEAGLIHFAQKGDISAVMPNLHCWSQQEHRVKWERQTILRATEVWCNEKNQLQCQIIFAGDIYSYRPLSSTFQAFSGIFRHQFASNVGRHRPGDHAFNCSPAATGSWKIIGKLLKKTASPLPSASTFHVD